MDARWRGLAALAVLLALTLIIYWPLTLSGEFTWLENPDQALQIRPWLDYEAREVHAGRVPLWDPYLWGGQSLVGQVQPGVMNPLNWILFAMPLRAGHIPVETLHWYWVMIHWLAAVFAYYLCRELGASLSASVLGGAAFAFLGFMGHSLSPQFLMSALWIPVVLLFFMRLLRGSRPWASAAACGAALGLAFLSGHHNIPIYAAVWMIPLWVSYLLGARRLTPTALSKTTAEGKSSFTGERRRQFLLRVAQAGVFIGVWFCVSAIQTLPALEYGRESVRWSGTPEPQQWKDRIPYSVHAEYSQPVKAVAGLIIPGWGMHAEPFVGITVAMLAVIAIVRRHRLAAVRLCAGAALIGLVLALGSHTSVHRVVYEWIPLIEKARYPAMAIVLCQISIAGLAAIGLDAWFRDRPRAVILWLLALFSAGLCAIYCGHLYPLNPRALGVAVVAGMLGAVLWRVRSLRFGPAIVLLLLIGEVFLWPIHFDRRDRPGSYAALISSHTDIATFLKNQPGWFRVEADENAIPYNFGDWFGIEQFGGYTASMPVRIFHVLGHRDNPERFGIRYRIAQAPSDQAPTEVFSSHSGLKIYETPRIVEPLRAIHRAPCAGADHLQVIRREPSRFVIDVDMACASAIETGDPVFRGWRAWVDAKRAAIREIATPFRAVDVPAGHHRIEFSYRPDSVYRGAALTLFGLSVALYIWVRERSVAALRQPEDRPPGGK